MNTSCGGTGSDDSDILTFDLYFMLNKTHTTYSNKQTQPSYSPFFFFFNSIDCFPTKHEAAMALSHSHLPSFYLGMYLFTEIPASVSEVLILQSLFSFAFIQRYFEMVISLVKSPSFLWD